MTKYIENDLGIVSVPSFDLKGKEMTAEELWQAYQKINPSIGDKIDAWAFGVQPDLLAQLVLEGTKTATASAYE